MAKRRPKHNKRRGMNRRMMGARKPMTAEQKTARKKLREEQSAADKAAYAAKAVKSE